MAVQTNNSRSIGEFNHWRQWRTRYQSWNGKNSNGESEVIPILLLNYNTLFSAETFKLLQLICYLLLSISTQALHHHLYLYLIYLYKQLLDLNRRHSKYQSINIADKSIWNIKCMGAYGIQRQISLKFMIQISTFPYLITQEEEVLCNWQSPQGAINPFISSIFTKK